MRIKVMAFAFNPEAKFAEYESFLQDNGVDICAYVSCTDQLTVLYQQHQPDLIVYDFGTVRIQLYAGIFGCRLLAATEEFNLQDHQETRELSEQRGQNGLSIYGYVEARPMFLLTAIRLVHEGQECFYTNQEIAQL